MEIIDIKRKTIAGLNGCHKPIVRKYQDNFNTIIKRAGSDEANIGVIHWLLYPL